MVDQENFRDDFHKIFDTNSKQKSIFKRYKSISILEFKDL